jgi:hypothetical protein
MAGHGQAEYDPEAPAGYSPAVRPHLPPGTGEPLAAPDGPDRRAHDAADRPPDEHDKQGDSEEGQRVKQEENEQDDEHGRPRRAGSRASGPT